MAKKIINVGSSPNAKDGDIVRDAFIKANQNFEDLYFRIQNIELVSIELQTIFEVDGGSSSTIYNEDLSISGGSAADIFDGTQTINGSGA